MKVAINKDKLAKVREKTKETASKVQENASKAYASRGADTKLIQNLVTLAVIGYVGWKVAGSVGSVADLVTGKKFEDEKKEVEEKNKVVINDLLTKVPSPTFDDVQAQSIADGLYRAFLNSQPDWSANLWDEGTDEGKVYYNLSKLKNQADWLLVCLKYGTPRARTLLAELHYELNKSEMIKVASILSKIGVKI